MMGRHHEWPSMRASRAVRGLPRAESARAVNHSGRLQWDPPPMLMAVEQILQHNLGKAIKDLRELGVQHGRCRSKSPALRQLDSYRLDASLDVDVEDPKATI